MKQYVHGYSPRESERLNDQARAVENFIHYDSIFPENSRVLEAGCGVGAQTAIIAAKNPKSRFVSIDISADSLERASDRVNSLSIKNVEFQRADINHPPFEDNEFDHIFICFLLEHLPNPVESLIRLKRLLKPGGTITVIEGDHGSWYCHPQTPEAAKTVQCLIDAQKKSGGNPFIGRELFPLLSKAGFHDIINTPRTIYTDNSKPELVEDFSKNTFIAMVEGVRNQALKSGSIKEKEWNRGISDLYKATEETGTFLYTFFRARARKF